MSKEMLEWALKYAEMGLSVIPVSQDKKPIIPWEPYQKKKASKKEIEDWFTKYPNANIGIVTGKVSGIAVIDIDDPDLKNKELDAIEMLASPPIVTTPRGGKHQWFAYPNTEVRNRTALFNKVDFRGEGGYVVAPPSSNGNKKQYVWKTDIFNTDLPMLPNNIINILKAPPSINYQNRTNTQQGQGVNPCKQPVSTLTNADSCFQLLTSGRRDEDLFHIANTLVKGGAKNHEIIQIIEILANNCTPPFPIKEAHEKIKSALNRTERKERSVMDDVKNWCDMQSGFFTTHELCVGLGLNTRHEKNAAYIALNRLKKENIIEKYGNKAGCYRRVDSEIDEMNWEDAPTKDLSIDYPLGIHELVKTYPTNIVIVAGTSNSGKTSLLLDLARRNANKFPIHYFNSEMGLSELKMRLDLFENADRELWKKIKFYERGDNFDDVIKPDAINIIDYLEVLDDFWKVGASIKAIHNKLKNGIAIIALQKNKGAELGRGGSLGLEKPRIYLSMEFGKVTIAKAKNWRTTENPNGKSIQFKIAGGWKIIPNSNGWTNE